MHAPRQGDHGPGEDWYGAVRGGAEGSGRSPAAMRRAPPAPRAAPTPRERRGRRAYLSARPSVVLCEHPPESRAETRKVTLPAEPPVLSVTVAL